MFESRRALVSGVSFAVLVVNVKAKIFKYDKLLDSVGIVDIIGHLDDDRIGIIVRSIITANRVRNIMEKVLSPQKSDNSKSFSSYIFPDDVKAIERIFLDNEIPITQQDTSNVFCQELKFEEYPLKRILDIVGSIVGLALFAPVMIVAAVAIKLNSNGPVFFCQKRVGKDGKPFKLFKLRSMVSEAEKFRDFLFRYNFRTGPVFKMVNDPRVTRVGLILRRWSIDEAPQFFNVLKGEMSLVGPRPLPIDEVCDAEIWQEWRLKTKPGMTGLWQISARHEPELSKWIALDIEYIKKQSLGLDLAILLKTIPSIIARKSDS